VTDRQTDKRETSVRLSVCLRQRASGIGRLHIAR